MSSVARRLNHCLWSFEPARVRPALASKQLASLSAVLATVPTATQNVPFLPGRGTNHTQVTRNDETQILMAAEVVGQIATDDRIDKLCKWTIGRRMRACTSGLADVGHRRDSNGDLTMLEKNW